MNAAERLARWIGGVREQESTLAERRQKLDAHLAKPAMSADAAEHRQWLATKRELEDDVAAEEGALKIARAEAETAKKAADQADSDAEEKRIRKVNDELAKAVLDLGAKLERLAPDVERYGRMLAEVEAWNTNRGNRPLIVDGERFVREVPEKIQPAQFEEQDIWEDGAGNQPFQFRLLASGERVPLVNGYTKRRERVQIRAEQVTPAHLPGGRFKDSIRLIGLKGQKLFPAR